MANFDEKIIIADIGEIERVLIVEFPDKLITLENVFSCQVTSDGDLDQTVKLTLEKTNDKSTFFPLPEDPIDADLGENTNHLRTIHFDMKFLYLRIDKQTATQGKLKVISFGG